MKNYQMTDEDERTGVVCEPAPVYGATAYRHGMTGQFAAPHHGSDEEADGEEAKNERWRNFCRSHFSGQRLAELEAHDFWIDCPPPVNEETEEEMEANIRKELEDPDANSIPYEDVLKELAILDKWAG